MFRTPAKNTIDPSSQITPPKLPQKPSAFLTRTKVQRDMGERGVGTVLFPEDSPVSSSRQNRLQEARVWVTKAKSALSASRNLKTDIKASVTQAIDRLYAIIKEAEVGKSVCPSSPVPLADSVGDQTDKPQQNREVAQTPDAVGKAEISQLLSSLAEHSKLMKESSEKAEELKMALQSKRDSLEVATYASVAAKGRRRPEPTALHSVVVTSRDEIETGEEVLGRVRKAINAKAEGIKIDRVRKAKDQKIVISCRSEEERNRVRTRIESADQQLVVQEVMNQDPLVILRDVLTFHKDEDIIEFLRMQNKRLFRDLPAGDDRVEIKFRKKARNALMSHVVARVSPSLWNRLVEASEVYVDLQLIRVEDQSPLVQCSMCLGYGHSRRLCTQTAEKCGYCGGPHQRSTCAEKLANATPTCCNCIVAKLEETGHNAFSMDCPVRRRWDSLARAKTAYC